MPLALPTLPVPRRSRSLALLGSGAMLCTLAGCTVGPDYVAPAIEAPADWSSWRSGAPALHPAQAGNGALAPTFWSVWHDPVLDELEARALSANPNIADAALRFAAARVQREGAGAAGLPQVNLKGSVTRERLSEYGASTRLFDVIGTSAERDQMAQFLANPFTLFQGGFDAAWEPDLWGKVRRSLEAADAAVQGQAALVQLARLSITSEVARAYFQLRTVQRQIDLAERDLALVDERARLVTARVKGGLDDHTALETERSSQAALTAGLPSLRANEASLLNALAILTGDHPGSLQALLERRDGSAPRGEPDLALGLPSEVALRRPDVQAAEAELHAATAKIGVAEADLYPSIRLGGGFNLESYKSENLFDWGSRTWSIGPSLNLPLFDGGQRRSVVALRKLEERQAAVNFQKTVLTAWQEIDDALNGYTAQRLRHGGLEARLASARRTRDLVQAQYAAGNLTYLPVLDAERGVLQAERDLADSEGTLRADYIAINKAAGNVPPLPPSTAEAVTSR
ncbi:efflux transporter outer membrane subunit [Novosphingobium profundi]|uniref:efflux transporter outer membrane subunit n=1 Tax=Novosphingobium profundi TaxID=1774954 RepID=UPI001BDB157C|nr:efflux transporter outer membrane subunit [Novosphingobium profundi]MBT0671061.1 efflux transporter outer membrane subunit [Novosphingobium profundi]